GPALAAPSPESPASQPAASFFRSIHAARRSGPVAIDGRPDELAWNAAELGEGFTQFEPDEGAPPTAPTRFRLLWDDDSIYVATASCFTASRSRARRKEQVQWRYRPRGSSGDVSLLGQLTGVRGIHPVRSLELRPYLASRSTMTRPAPGPASAPFRFAPCSSFGIGANGVAAGCAGVDLRYSLASDLSLVATVNPDFGQVEADQRVLNLSTFETFFPEKRPFFTEGLDLFQSPLRISFGGAYGGDAYQVFYSRRIGKPPPDWETANGTLLYQPSAQ